MPLLNLGRKCPSKMKYWKIGVATEIVIGLLFVLAVYRAVNISWNSPAEIFGAGGTWFLLVALIGGVSARALLIKPRYTKEELLLVLTSEWKPPGVILHEMARPKLLFGGPIEAGCKEPEFDWLIGTLKALEQEGLVEQRVALRPFRIGNEYRLCDSDP